MALEITSDAFEPGAAIPKKYTCDGANVSPPLQWTGAPPETVAFALVLEDPDAPNGTFSHWVVYNLPATVTRLSEGATRRDIEKKGGEVGRNDFGRDEYGGCCPPPGPAHNYSFRLYALDDQADLPEDATRQQLFQSIQSSIIAEAVLVGRYARKPISSVV